MENVPNEIIYKIFEFSPGYLLECVFRHVNSLWNYLCDIALKNKRENFGKYLCNGTYRITKFKKRIESNSCICSCHATLSKVDKDINFTPRYKQSSCYLNGSIYIFGGQPEPSSKLNDLWRVNLIDKTVSKILCNKNNPSNLSQDFPCPRSSSSLLSLPSLSGDKLVLFGGHALSSTLFELPRMLNTLHLFDVKTEAWQKINPFASFTRLTSKSNNLYDESRENSIHEHLLNDVNKMFYSDDAEFSELRASFLHPPPTAGHSAAICELKYCPNQFPHLPNHETSLKGKFMLIFGGLCSPGPYSSNSLWVFDFQNMSWSQGPLIPHAHGIERSDDNENTTPSMGPMSRFNHFDALMMGPNGVDWLIVGGISTTGYKYMDAWLLRTNGLYPSSSPSSSDTTPYLLQQEQKEYHFTPNESNLIDNPSFPRELQQQQHAGWYWVEVRIKNCFSKILRGSDAGVSLSSKTNSFKLDTDHEVPKSPHDNTLVDVPPYWPSNLWSRSCAYLKHQKLLLTFATSPRTYMTDDKIEVSSLINSKPKWDRQDDVSFNKRRKLGLFLHNPISEGSAENTSSADCQSSSHRCFNNEEDSIFNRNLDRFLSPNNLSYNGTGYGMIDISTSITNSSPLPPTATTTITTTLTQESTNDDNSSPSSSTNNNAVVNNLTNLFNDNLTSCFTFPTLDSVIDRKYEISQIMPNPRKKNSLGLKLNTPSSYNNITNITQSGKRSSYPPLGKDVSDTIIIKPRGSCPEDYFYDLRTPHVLSLEHKMTNFTTNINSNKSADISYREETNVIVSRDKSSKILPNSCHVPKTVAAGTPSFTNNSKLDILERMKSRFMPSTSSAPVGVEPTTSALLSHHDQTHQEQIPSTLNDNNTTANNLNCHCPCNKSNKSASTPGPTHLNHTGTIGAKKCLSSITEKQQANGGGKRLNTMDMFYLDLKPLEQALAEFDLKNNLTTSGKCDRRLIQTTDLPILQWRLSPSSSNKIMTLPEQQNSMISEFVPSISSNNIPETIFYSLLSTDEECQLALLGGARIHIPAMANHVPEITVDKLTNDIFLID